ncbi:MAG: prepilin-type N-terminal cleavage/methylation domain-containing protein [Candidatus Omnitrophota bacterium]|nr:prepilin-type N-terminal cleavage/methylation domain-containing protein [Candidatus Omnitrophota bacterium]
MINSFYANNTVNSRLPKDKPFVRTNPGWYRSGFTLIEIIISALIMAVTIGGLFSVFIAGNRYTFRTGRRLMAVNLIQQEIEFRRQAVRQDWWLMAANPDPLLNWLAINGAWTNWSVAAVGDPFQMQYRYRVDQDTHNNFPSLVNDGGQCRRAYMQVRWSER